MNRNVLSSIFRTVRRRTALKVVAPLIGLLAWIGPVVPQTASADITCASAELDLKIVAPRGGPIDQFGHAVAISGDLAVVGARYEADASGIRAGAAYVFLRSGSTWTLEARLQASDALADDYFGSSVAIFGDTIVVGAPGDDEVAGAATGAAYVFTRTVVGPLATWTQTVKLVDAAPTAADEFGESVAISGDYAVIGSSGDDDLASGAGAAHVFRRVAGVWSFAAKLTASDGASGDAFGSSVAIDGSSILVGAPLDNNGFTNDEGAAYVFLATGPTTFAQQAKIAPTSSLDAGDQFGFAVAIDGDTLACGAPFDDDGFIDSDAGRVFVYTRAGTTWTQRAQLTEAEPDGDRRFGGALALDGDTLVIGSPTDNLPSNFVSVFVRTGGLTGSWAEQTTLSNPGGLAAYFGVSVAISGETLFTSARGDGTGRFLGHGLARVFTRAGGPAGTWSQQAVLGEFDDLTAADDSLGRSIAANSEWLVIGCPNDDNFRGVDAGSVYVYRYQSGAWVYWTRLYASEGQAGDRFGWSVSLGTDTIAIGASADDDVTLNGGSVYVYTLTSNTWIIQQKILPTAVQFAGSFGVSVSLSGNTLAVGAGQATGNLPSGFHGVTQVFTRSGTVWSLQATLEPAGLETADNFGGEVVLVGDLLAVAAANADDLSAQDAGAVFMYERASGVWTLAQTLRAPVPAIQAQFGFDIELRADRVVIGENFRLVNNSPILRGVVHTFSRVGSDPWTFESTLSPASPEEGLGFGTALAMVGDLLCVGFDGSTVVPMPSVTDAGEVRLYGYSASNTWTEVARFRSPVPTTNQSFGDALALVGDQLIVGATGDQAAGGLRSGAAYVYTLSLLDDSGTTSTFTEPVCDDSPAIFSLDVGDSLNAAIQWEWATDGVNFDPIVEGLNTAGVVSFTAAGVTTTTLTLTPVGLWPLPRMGAIRAHYSTACGEVDTDDAATALAAYGPCCTIPIDPKATYLRQNTGGTNAVAHLLADCRLAPGMTGRFEVLGEYEYNLNSQTRTEAAAVFSSSNVLLAPDVLARVPGALSAPGSPAALTLPSFSGGLPSDIPEDIRLFPPVFTIPAGAQYLFLTANDDLFNDNLDSDGDYAARFHVIQGAAISQAPVSVYACGHTPVDFTVGASPGGPLTYTWGFDVDPPSVVFVELNENRLYTVGLGTKFNVTGAGTTELTLSPGTGGRWRANNSGRVRVRVFNVYGNETSVPVLLTVCSADFDCNHAVDVVDLFSFLDTWFAQSGLTPPAPPAVNADHDGDGDVDVVDLFDFLDSWFAQNGVCG